MKKFLKVLFWAVVVLVLIQFVPVDRTNPPVKKSENFVDILATPPSVQILLKNACYDCHSNETKYPKYAYIAPVSWSIKDHVNEGREHLNFSIWATYNNDLKTSMLENASADLEQNRMPIAGYALQHPKANLNNAEKKLLIDYFNELRKSGKY